MIKPIHAWAILLIGVIILIAVEYYDDGIIEERKLYMIIGGFLIIGIIYTIGIRWFVRKWFR